MSDAYEDDLAAEQAIFDSLAQAQPEVFDIEFEQRPRGGRPAKVNPVKLVAWRQAHDATVAATAARWGVSEATVKRLSREHGEAAKAERKRWECEQLDRELRQQEYQLSMMFLSQRSKHLAWVDLEWFRACEAAKGTEREEAVEAARTAALDAADREFRTEWERTMGPISVAG